MNLANNRAGNQGLRQTFALLTRYFDRNGATCCYWPRCFWAALPCN